MNKPGDIVQGFGDPINCEAPLGQVILHKFIKDSERLELWLVEYTDQPEHFYELFIKKQEDGKNKS